jgi:uncharacterized membrane protein YccC
MTWGEIIGLVLTALGGAGGAVFGVVRWAINRLCGRLDGLAKAIADHRVESKQTDERHGAAIGTLQQSVEEQSRRIDEIRQDVRDLRTNDRRDHHER